MPKNRFFVTILVETFAWILGGAHRFRAPSAWLVRDRGLTSSTFTSSANPFSTDSKKGGKWSPKIPTRQSKQRWRPWRPSTILCSSTDHHTPLSINIGWYQRFKGPKVPSNSLIPGPAAGDARPLLLHHTALADSSSVSLSGHKHDIHHEGRYIAIHISPLWCYRHLPFFPSTTMGENLIDIDSTCIPTIRSKNYQTSRNSTKKNLLIEAKKETTNKSKKAVRLYINGHRTWQAKMQHSYRDEYTVRYQAKFQAW